MNKSAIKLSKHNNQLQNATDSKNTFSLIKLIDHHK